MKPKIHIYTPNNLIKQKISENVSCCSPKSLSNLRNQSKEYLLKSNLNKTSKIRLHTEYMELGETSFIREIKDKGNSYSNYSKNFKNMVLDQEGNYLYTKINQEKNEKIEKTSNYSFNAKKQQMIKNYSRGKEYINLIDEKIKSLDEDDKNISNSSNKKVTYQNFIDSIKIKKYNCLFSDLLNKSKQEIINNFQLQIESLIKEYSLNIEKLSKENFDLKEENKKMKLNLDETIEISEFLKRKNVVLNEKLNDQKEKFEEQLKANFELEQFQKWLNLLKEKFPNYSLEKLINKHELLEQTLTELVKKVAELEETTKKTENEKNNEINIFKNKFVTIQEKEKKREKEVIDLQNQLNFQGKDSNEIHNYKDRFFLIFKKLVNLYNKWNKKIKVYNGLDINFNDPCEIIDFLDKFIQISTPDNIQKYLRKIIVSANSLQREHFKKFINERFDPDKIYERINKKINYLKNKAKLEITSKDNESDSSFLKEAWS